MGGGIFSILNHDFFCLIKINKEIIKPGGESIFVALNMYLSIFSVRNTYTAATLVTADNGNVEIRDLRCALWRVRRQNVPHS